MNNNRPAKTRDRATAGQRVRAGRERESRPRVISALVGLLMSIPPVALADPATQLAAALSSASGGETVILADGYYGDLTLGSWQSFPRNVTIQSANPLGATFGTVKINADNVTLDGLTINGRLTIQNANSVTVSHSRLNNWNEALHATNVIFAGNNSRGTISIEETTGFRLIDNHVREIPGDLMRVIGNSSDGIVENNVLWDMLPKRFADGSTIHADALQMFSTPNGTPHDIVIRGNHVYDDPTTGDTGNLWGQGIFLGGPTGGYRNILIEQNLVATDSPNAIYVSVGSSGNIVRNNTVLGSGTITAKSGDSSGTVIRDNVARHIIAEDGAVATRNHLYTDARRLFRSGANGARAEDFLPRPGTPIDFGSGYGALARLEALFKR